VKFDLPSVNEALQRLEREIALARRDKSVVLKIIHGFGSSGVGGDIRIAVQKRLQNWRRLARFAAASLGRVGRRAVTKAGDSCNHSRG
jgi:dsDNA-specific endonuclease/ATPase MutS2